MHEYELFFDSNVKLTKYKHDVKIIGHLQFNFSDFSALVSDSKTCYINVIGVVSHKLKPNAHEQFGGMKSYSMVVELSDPTECRIDLDLRVYDENLLPKKIGDAIAIKSVKLNVALNRFFTIDYHSLCIISPEFNQTHHLQSWWCRDNFDREVFRPFTKLINLFKYLILGFCQT
jgi:hypothetical protein